MLALDLRDNGVGAAPRAFEASDAYGVMGMRERARHLGGTLHIHSSPGQGCRVRLLLPLDKLLPTEASP